MAATNVFQCATISQQFHSLRPSDTRWTYWAHTTNTPTTPQRQHCPYTLLLQFNLLFHSITTAFICFSSHDCQAAVGYGVPPPMPDARCPMSDGWWLMPDRLPGYSSVLLVCVRWKYCIFNLWSLSAGVVHCRRHFRHLFMSLDEQSNVDCCVDLIKLLGEKESNNWWYILYINCVYKQIFVCLLGCTYGRIYI